MPAEHVGTLHLTDDRTGVYATCSDGWRSSTWSVAADRSGRANQRATDEFASHADATPDPSGMPVFVIKAKDTLAIEAIQAYRTLCLRQGLADMAAQVDLALDEIAAWQAAHPDDVRLPSHRHVPVPPRPDKPVRGQIRG